MNLHIEIPETNEYNYKPHPWTSELLNKYLNKDKLLICCEEQEDINSTKTISRKKEIKILKKLESCLL